MSSENGATPTFDLSKVGYGWQKKYMRVNVRIVRNDTLIRNTSDESASEENRRTVQIARLEAMEELPELTDQRDALISQVLQDVPREWLIPGAPKSLNWSSVESLDYLQTGKLEAIQGALNEALSPKNS